MSFCNVICLATAQPIAATPAADLRPATLVRAARAGMLLYRRARDLRILLRCDALPGRAQAVAYLRAEEARLDRARRAGAADYDAARHVLASAALLAESAMLRESLCPPAVVSGPGTARPARL